MFCLSTLCKMPKTPEDSNRVCYQQNGQHLIVHMFLTLQAKLARFTLHCLLHPHTMLFICLRGKCVSIIIIIIIFVTGFELPHTIINT